MVADRAAIHGWKGEGLAAVTMADPSTGRVPASAGWEAGRRSVKRRMRPRDREGSDESFGSSPGPFAFLGKIFGAALRGAADSAAAYVSRPRSLALPALICTRTSHPERVCASPGSSYVAPELLWCFLAVGVGERGLSSPFASAGGSSLARLRSPLLPGSGCASLGRLDRWTCRGSF